MDIHLLLISYLIPLIVYSYDYYKDIDKEIEMDSLRANFLKKKAKNFPYLLSFYIISLVTLLFLYSNITLDLFILAIVIVGILYNVLLKDLTKRIPIFKNVYTGLTWAFCGAFFPLFYYSIHINLSFIIIFSLIFLRVIIDIIYFDLKDINDDKSKNIKTLPVIMGKKSTINILNIINAISFIPLLLGVYFHMFNIIAAALLIFFIYGYYYINKAKSASKIELESTAYKLADSEFILWPLVLLAVNFII